MKILVTGVNGQLGYDVVRKGKKLGLEMIGVDIQDLDITKKEDVFHYILDTKPGAIIHCAAYTAVDKAEDDKQTCWDVNVEGTKYLAKAAKEVNAKFIYISTDYVYNGKGEEAFLESDIPAPLGYYGLTKLEGENVVQELLHDFFIVRISWVFIMLLMKVFVVGQTLRKKSFLKLVKTSLCTQYRRLNIQRRRSDQQTLECQNKSLSIMVLLL